MWAQNAKFKPGAAYRVLASCPRFRLRLRREGDTPAPSPCALVGNLPSLPCCRVKGQTGDSCFPHSSLPAPHTIPKDLLQRGLSPRSIALGANAALLPDFCTVSHLLLARCLARKTGACSLGNLASGVTTSDGAAAVLRAAVLALKNPKAKNCT